MEIKMRLSSFMIPDDLREWALEYVTRKQIKGRNNAYSLSELIRRLLEEERRKDEEALKRIKNH
jgi:predicted CopG family antitoxin